MIRRAWQLFEAALQLAEQNGMCHCGADLRTHSGYDNHGPVWMQQPEDDFLRAVLGDITLTPHQKAVLRHLKTGKPLQLHRGRKIS